MPVDVRRFPWFRRLAVDYAFDFLKVAPFFAGDPAEPGAWADAIARTQAHDRQRDAIAAIVAAQQDRRQAPLKAREAARLLADRHTVAVVTGQQAGLFGGPLFTLFKALTAIKLAERVGRDHGVPAVAVFWIDAEDHDWEEVRSCTVFDEALAPRAVALAPRPGAKPAPVATVQVDESILAVLTELEQYLPPTDFRSSLLAGLRRAYTPGIGMADAFGRWMEEVLGHRGLVVYDSSDVASKALASPLFTRELSTPGHTGTLAALAGSDLTARGYHAQVRAHDAGLALFHVGEDGRLPIRQHEGRFVVGERQYEAAALAAEARDRPASFSPGVLLRPLVQDSLFPTICYVAGPSELAYLGQLRGVYEHFGIPMPLIYQRATATLFDSAALRFLTRSQLPLEALQPQDEAALNQFLRTQLSPGVEESLAEASRVIEAQMLRVVQALPALDPTLEGAARATMGRMQHDIQTLRGKMIQAAKRRDETLRRQFLRTRALAFPGGHPQERTIGFISFLNQYGPALVDRLDEELPLDLGRHWIVTI
jgi:bacillithiol biosynthesis cysteine-adding enzyme BshC